MITRLIMAFALALAGCALNEYAPRLETPVLSYASANAPQAVAECMARNMHNELLGAHAAVRPMRSGQGPEIIARVRHALD